MTQEFYLLLKQRSIIWLLCISTLLTCLSLFNGWKNISHMRAQIMHAQQEEKHRHVQQRIEFATHGNINAGEVGYYMFHNAYRHPTDWSFIALGNRAVTPYVQRIRLLGLQGQIYDGESHHPEYIMLGAFDYAFWLVFFLPLITIALMHDLKASEFQAHRLTLLQSLVSHPVKFWMTRTGLRWALVLITFLIPLFCLGLTHSLPPLALAQVTFVTLLYSLFWLGLCVAFSLREKALNANINAMLLVTIWLMVCVVMPNIFQLWVHHRYPVQEGSQIALQHRQLVHNAWDQPKTDTLTSFYKLYPQWQHTLPVTERFHWKWYFAFQHMADVKLSSYIEQRENRLRLRERATATISYLLPSLWVQRKLEDVAKSNVTHLLEHRTNIQDFHTKLRHTLYPYLFEDKPIPPQAFKNLPQFD